MTMARDDKKIKTEPAPKKEIPPKNDSTSGADTSKVEGGKVAEKVEGGKVADASPSSYSRGEGQKPVSKAYRDNWNAIYAKKKKR
jgi:hypothetical protein